MQEARQLKLNNAVSVDGECVVYVMSRDQRVHDNHALLAAQKFALESKLPLAVVFILLPKSGVRSKEQYDFMLDGLEDVKSQLEALHIQFVIVSGNPVEAIPEIVEKLHAKELFFDFNSLKGVRAMQKTISKSLNIPCTVVDTHNIIPLWVLSDKEEYAAHTIRNKIHKNLESWVVEPEKIVKHPHEVSGGIESLSISEARVLVEADITGVKYTYKAGEKAANKQLKDFIGSGLEEYATKRNIPTENGQSNLSPYLHFGHISSLRVALELLNAASEPPLLFLRGKLVSYEGTPTKMDSINALLEELIVRKELADNYCFYNKDYDRLDGAKDWAKKSLGEHENDEREFIYNLDQWEAAITHDDAWNAAQNEMMQTGKMHGYMRMYWAKKILEWSSSAEEAIQIAIYLNDKYSIDGGDPNGYTGIMWSIAGIHDRPWFERSVFGKIRYMNRGGLERRFDIEKYIANWK